MSPINTTGENKITLIMPCSEDPGVGVMGRAYGNLHPDKSSYAHGRLERACLRENED